MKKAFIFGERSKMGLNLIKNLDELEIILLDEFLAQGADYLFLTGTREASLEFLNGNSNLAKKIFDFSGATKFLALSGDKKYSYALNSQSSKIISFPGCASWAILQTLIIISDILPDKIWASVNYPQSAIGRNSQNKQNSFIHPFSHLQEKEMNMFFQKENFIKMVPSIVSNETGLTFSLMFEGNDTVDYLEKFKKNKNDEVVVCEKPSEVNPQEEKILINITQQGKNVCVIGATNNLVGKKYKKYL